MDGEPRASAPGVEYPTLRVFVLLFVLGFAIRGTVLVSGILPESYLRPRGEIGKVAVSLARTGEFANPYKIPTGPTAHPTPVYTGLLGLIYSVFGVTAMAGYVRGVVAITSYSALYAALPWLGGRLGLGTRAGIVAGLVGAVIPQQGVGEVIGNCDAPFATIALVGLMVAFLERWTAGRWSTAGSLVLGIGCGAAFHCSPPLLLVVVGGLLFELWWSRDRRRWLAAACVALGAVLACVPWAWRNYTAFHEFLLVRGNFGLELRLANHDGAAADIDVAVARDAVLRHPSASLEEAGKVRDLGEAEYMRQAREEAVAWIRGHPGEFLRLTAMRAVHFWCGPLRVPWLAGAMTAVTALALLSLRHRIGALTIPQRAAVLIPLAAFPLVYYGVSYVSHYRGPLEWLLLLLAGAEVQRWVGDTGRGS